MHPGETMVLGRIDDGGGETAWKIAIGRLNGQQNGASKTADDETSDMEKRGA